MTKGLTYELIKGAVSGNETSINKLVSIYDPYIRTLASRELFDSNGNEYIGIDVDLYDQLKSKLVHIIHHYRIA